MTVREKDTPNKLSIYEALYALNRGFEQVLQELDLLQQSPLFRGNQFIKSCRLAVQETCAWASFEVLEILRDSEESDWARYGQLRRTRELRLEDTGEVLTGAERLNRGLPHRDKRTKPAKTRKLRLPTEKR